MALEIQETSWNAIHSLRITEHVTIKSSDDSTVINIDEKVEFAAEIFENLCALERKKRRPVRKTQVDKNRGYYIDWFVDIVKALGFSEETLYYAIRYFDSCVMGKETNTSRANLICLACFILASKYEEIRYPSMTVYAKRYNFSCKQIIDMERYVLKCLGYNLSNPTTWSFMERFIRAAQGGSELRCMASYIAALSLYSYNMNSYLPSMVAASSIFLAKYILRPFKMPWTATLQHYTRYRSSELQDCVMELLDIAIGETRGFSGIREKYCQFVNHRVAFNSIPPSIPVEFFKGVYLPSNTISMVIDV